jgi:ATP-binding protein involved in chromosome partitioning
VTVAISIVEGQRLGHLGEARHFVLVEVEPRNRAVIRSQVVAAPSHEPGSFPRWLREQGAQVMITAGLGQRALDNLNHHGVEVRVGQPGVPAESLVAAWLAGHLTRPSNGCAHQHGEAAGHECRLSDYLEERD